MPVASYVEGFYFSWMDLECVIVVAVAVVILWLSPKDNCRNSCCHSLLIGRCTADELRFGPRVWFSFLFSDTSCRLSLHFWASRTFLLPLPIEHFLLTSTSAHFNAVLNHRNRLFSRCKTFFGYVSPDQLVLYGC